MAIAIFVGVVIAVSQTAAMLELPLFFHLILGYGPVVAMIALTPLFAALVLAGPAAGFLISRISPRWLVGGGVLAVGVGNLLLALITTDSAPYPGFVVPCLLIGAGFVVATTVRTAIIFASVPRGLPATAAALNEASISVGMRIGIVLVTTLVTEVALSTYTASVASLPTAEATQAIAAFRELLVAIGTPAFNEIATAVGPIDARPTSMPTRPAYGQRSCSAASRRSWAGSSRSWRSDGATRWRPSGTTATSAWPPRADRRGGDRGHGTPAVVHDGRGRSVRRGSRD